MVVVTPLALSFAGLLRQLRGEAGLTQEELAEAAGVSARSISDLERGVNVTARRDTARLLADALGLAGGARAAFEAAAAGRSVAGGSPSRGVAVQGVAAATRTLPRDLVSFIGRERELGFLTAAAAGAGGVMRVCAIAGMAGIGKTAFAVRASHQLAEHFPDGQIFLPLHGHTPGQRPVAPADALASLLFTAGVAQQGIPPEVEGRTRLWRDHLAGRRMLLVLDDAAGHEQVRPLLPGSAGSMVLITSRRHLTALEDAEIISLDTLQPDEAVRLLIRLADRPGLDPADSAAVEITRLCGCLPLAIGLLARQLRHHPAWSAADLAADLTAARDRLGLITAENVSVSAAFDLSYQDLAASQQRMFRHLGLHPGTDLGAYGAAALDGISVEGARRILNVLYDQSLLTEPERGRYRMHDLIREHARTLASTDAADDRDAALGRLLNYYLHTARAADRYLVRRSLAHRVAVAPIPPADFPDLSTRDRAVAWMTAERFNLHAATAYAASHDYLDHAIAIPAAMHGFLRSHGHWDQSLSLHQAAVDASRDTADPLAEATALADLGHTQYLTGDYNSATSSLTTALQLCRAHGDRLGEANALNSLGTVQYYTGNHASAAASHAQALDIYLDHTDLLGEANALQHLAATQHATGAYPGATASLTRARAIYHDCGDSLGEANALHHLGAIQCLAGEYPAATTSLTAALDLHQAINDRLGEADTLKNLGAVHEATGNYREATASLARALQLYGDLGAKNGEANVLCYLGSTQCSAGDYRTALATLASALILHQRLGSRLGEAMAHNYIGAAYYAAGDPPAAIASLAKALESHRLLGARAGEAEVLNNMGQAMLATAAASDAHALHTQALTIATSIASPLQEARALEGIGRCHIQQSQPEQAAICLRQALAIYERIGSPRALRVQAILNSLETTR